MKTELLLEQPEWVLNLRADVGFVGFEETQQPSLGCIWGCPGFVDRCQGSTGESVRVLMNCCS